MMEHGGFFIFSQINLMLKHYGLSNSSAIQGSNSVNQGSGRTNGCQLVAGGIHSY